MTLLGAAALLWRTHSSLKWQGLPCLVALLIFLPWVQFFFGLLPFAGQAWISSAYLLGFLLSLLIGAQWEKVSPKQLAHGLLMAVGIAAIGSVGLQLYAWLGLYESGFLGIFSLDPLGSRPYANLGQPNQLASLLIWGLLACLWFYIHRFFTAGPAIFVAAFLLLGLALTQSRAGHLALIVILLAIWFWHKLWPSRHMPKLAALLYLYFLACPFLFRWLNSAWLLGQDEIYTRVQQQGEIRTAAWNLFIQAIIERPWFGYGWTEVSSAQIAVADQFPSLYGIFQLSHNIFLDLLLWTGLPIGMLIILTLTRWFWLRFRAIAIPENAVLFLLLLSIGIHALVEFPLQYAYFLFPVGLVMGVLNTRLGGRTIISTPHWVLSGIWMIAALVLGVTVIDYARVDVSYGRLRLEQSIVGQGRGPMGAPPNVWALTQLREWIVVARYKPRPDMEKQEIDAMRTLTLAYPSLTSVYRLAHALALNGKSDEALLWLNKICKFTNENQCRLAQRTWERESPGDPRTAKIQWPLATTTETEKK